MCPLPIGCLARCGAALPWRVVEEPGDVLLELCGVVPLAESIGRALLAIAQFRTENVEDAGAVVVVGLANTVVLGVVLAARSHPRIVVVYPGLFKSEP